MKLTSPLLNGVLTATMLHASGTWAEVKPAALECPHCGEWTLMWSQPPGATGERLVVDAERVSIPMCGDFRPTVTSSTFKTEEGGLRTYHVTLALLGYGRGACATQNKGLDVLRAEVDIGVAYHREGGFGEFAIVDRATSATVFAASGWNYERDNPCDTGSGRGSTACMVVANAELQRQLSQSALIANPDYRVGRVVRAAERACKNDGQGAGGSWPGYYEEACKWELLEEKLKAFNAFHECRNKKRRECRVPNEKVGRPATGDS